MGQRNLEFIRLALKNEENLKKSSPKKDQEMQESGKSEPPEFSFVGEIIPREVGRELVYRAEQITLEQITPPKLPPAPLASAAPASSSSSTTTRGGGRGGGGGGRGGRGGGGGGRGGRGGGGGRGDRGRSRVQGQYQ